jgi:hypothetical protein
VRTKLSVLRACRRVLRRGGNIAFITIEPTPGLNAERRRRAHLVGPAAVAVPTSYPSLLSSAGFVQIEESDLTSEFLATQLSWIESLGARAAAVAQLMGHDAYAERMGERERAVEATEAGLLGRFMYTASRR